MAPTWSLAEATDAAGDTALRVPVAIEVGGARTTVEVEVRGRDGRLVGHRVPVDPQLESGFGAVALPADWRPGDDRFWFTYGSTPVVETAVLAETPRVADVLAIAATSPADPDVRHEVREVSVADADALDLAGTSLLLWQAPLPEGEAAERARRFCEAGGNVVFLPPDAPRAGAFAGLGWGRWRGRRRRE